MSLKAHVVLLDWGADQEHHSAYWTSARGILNAGYCFDTHEEACVEAAALAKQEGCPARVYKLVETEFYSPRGEKEHAL